MILLCYDGSESSRHVVSFTAHPWSSTADCGAPIRGGARIDTTMGFTPLDGLVMATRSGSIDPGMLLRLLGV